MTKSKLDKTSLSVLADTDPLARGRDVLDPLAMRALHKQRTQLDETADTVQKALGSMGPADLVLRRYRSPLRDTLDALSKPDPIKRAAEEIRAGLNIGLASRAVDHGQPVTSAADIGRRVRQARRAMGMTQQRFADFAGVGRRFIVELEKGKPSLEIGRVLGVCAAAGIKLSMNR